MNILVIAAHPDDEVLGCGGTIAGMIRSGGRAFLLLLTDGVKGRYDREKWNSREVKQKIENLMNATEESSRIIGFEKVFRCGFDDQHLEYYPIGNIVKCIEKVVREIQPDIIFTHSPEDLNMDHVVAFKATVTVARPSSGVKEIYSFEIPSSTDWNPVGIFRPNVFYDITQFFEIKKKALSKYASELRKYPHPRSLEGVEILARFRGMQSGFKYAESFTVVKFLKNLTKFE